jgi:hypothetical protein
MNPRARRGAGFAALAAVALAALASWLSHDGEMRSESIELGSPSAPVAIAETSMSGGAADGDLRADRSDREPVPGEATPDGAVENAPPEDEADVTGTSEPPRVLVGRVLAADSRRPLEGIAVETEFSEIAGVTTRRLTSVSGSDGEFRLEGLPKSATLELVLRSAGGVRHVHHVDPLRPGETRAQFLLEDEIELHGRVVDAATGAPLGEAVLTIDGGIDFDHESAFASRVVSGVEGSFVVPVPVSRASREAVAVELRRDGYLAMRTTLDVASRDAPVDIAMARGVDVEIELLDAATMAPIAGSLDVWWQRRPPATEYGLPEEAKLLGDGERIMVDVTGRARFTGPPHVGLSVRGDSAWHEPRESETLRLGVPGSAIFGSVPLIASRLARLHGRLTFNGKAGRVPYVLFGGAGAAGEADAHGRYAIEALAPGKYVMEARIPGLVSKRAAVLLAPEDDHRLDLDLECAIAPLGGIVRCGAAPLQGVVIEIAEAGGERDAFRTEVVTDSRGRFATLVPFLPGMPFEATIHLGLDVFARTIVSGLDDQVIDVPELLELRARVLDAAGDRPIATPYVRMRRVEAPVATFVPRRECATDLAGLLVLPVMQGIFEVDFAQNASFYGAVRVTLVAGRDPTPVVVRVPHVATGTLVLEEARYADMSTALPVAGQSGYVRPAGSDSPFVTLERAAQHRPRHGAIEYQLPIGSFELGFGLRDSPPTTATTTIEIRADRPERLGVR